MKRQSLVRGKLKNLVNITVGREEIEWWSSEKKARGEIWNMYWNFFSKPICRLSHKYSWAVGANYVHHIIYLVENLHISSLNEIIWRSTVIYDSTVCQLSSRICDESPLKLRNFVDFYSRFLCWVEWKKSLATTFIDRKVCSLT